MLSSVSVRLHACVHIRLVQFHDDGDREIEENTAAKSVMMWVNDDESAHSNPTIPPSRCMPRFESTSSDCECALCVELRNLCCVALCSATGSRVDEHESVSPRMGACMRAPLRVCSCVFGAAGR